jgi:hypothetical protein
MLNRKRDRGGRGFGKIDRTGGFKEAAGATFEERE